MIFKKKSTDSLAIENSGKVRQSLDELIVKLNSVPVPHSSFVWLYVWSLIDDICGENPRYSNTFALKEGVSRDIIWNKLYETWKEPPLNEPTLEYGYDSLDDQIIDWLLDYNFIIDIQEVDDEQ